MTQDQHDVLTDVIRATRLHTLHCAVALCENIIEVSPSMPASGLVAALRGLIDQCNTLTPVSDPEMVRMAETPRGLDS